MPIVSGRKGKRPFSFRRKQTFRREFVLKLLEGQIERPLPLRLHVFDVELQVAADRIEAHSPIAQHRHAVFRDEAQPCALAAKHDRAHLALVVLEGEIKMARWRDAKIGNFALNPQGLDPGFQGAFDELVQLADSQELGLCGSEQRQFGIYFDSSHHGLVSRATKKLALHGEG